MNEGWKKLVTAAVITLMIMPGTVRAQSGGPLKINHTPVTWGVKGQSLTLKARISGGVGGIESVTLYYALFRDAAPFRVAMVSSGMDTFVGTIDANLLTGVEHVSYYIEAQDKEGTIEETPWYDVKFKAPEAAPAVRSGSGQGASGNAATQEEGMSALTIGLIAGGAVAVGAGAYFLSDSGGSDDDDGGGGGGGGGGSVTNAGNYAGNATLCSTSAGSGTTCNTTTATFIIDSQGKIVSENLYPGKTLSGTVSGNEFSLVADVTGSAEGLTGTAVYSGTVINGTRIVGTVTGNYDVFGVPGTYSGTFSATKQ